MNARSERLARRNQVQLLHDSGQLNDPWFSKQLDKFYEGVEISDLAGDYYDVVYSPRGAKKDKVSLRAKPRGHGMSKDPSTYRATIAAEGQLRSGDTSMAGPAKDLEKIAAFLQKNVMPGDITKVGSLGSREAPTEEQALMRAAALLGDVDRGYDPVTGVAFNGMPLDAGHIISHISRPDLSNDPANIRFQNAYENKGQAAAEKFAGQQGREATNEELADALWKNLINKAVAGVSLPRKGSKAYKEYMDPINAKVARYAGEIAL